MARYCAPVAGHVPRKRFGQNFLVDQGVVEKIIDAIDPRAEDRMVEIGPGLGVLTEPLLARLRELHAIEIDRDLAAGLAERFAPQRLHIHRCDALRFDFCSLGTDLRVVGNLPYNISSPLLFHLAQAAGCVRDCHVMLQREVADRIVAAPGGRAYGRLSVMLQYRFAVQRLLLVPAGAFRPAPKVESAFLRLMPHRPLEAADDATFAAVVAKAFGQRRKTLRNALRELLSSEQIKQAGVDPGLRPEALTVAAFVRIADRVVAQARRPADAG